MVGPIERNVNVVQEILESTGTHVGRIISIITRTVQDVAREVNDAVADGFDIAEARRQARADAEGWEESDSAHRPGPVVDGEVEAEETVAADGGIEAVGRAEHGEGHLHEDVPSHGQ